MHSVFYDLKVYSEEVRRKTMVSSGMYELGSKRSVIREIFEYAKQRAEEVGAQNVFDFSIGNPNVPAPACVKEAIVELMNEPDSTAIHGYTSAQGDYQTRRVIAESIQKRFGAQVVPECIYMTCGAAASVTISACALYEPGDEFITFAPYFTEYKVFVRTAGAELIVVPTKEDTFQIDVEAFAAAINEHTKGVIINSPNNPSGVVYSEQSIRNMCAVLEEKQRQYGRPIFLISDEPYREIVYDGVQVPYLPNYYDNTIVCYSYSKALSLPGERIGYIMVSPRIADWQRVYAAVCGAGRALGYVCAPSLMQKVIARCEGSTSDVSIYKRNRDLLYNALCSYGYTCVKPDGAFYLFVKAPGGDAYELYERGKQFDLLLVPSDDFGVPGYVRVAYCVQTETIERALPAFEKLIRSYQKD